MKARPLALDIGSTVLLTGVLVGAATMLGRGGLQMGALPFWHDLGVQLSIFAVFLGVERIAPAGPHKSVTAWFLNLRINILATFTYTLMGAVAAIAIVALGRHCHLGLINLRVVAWDGFVGVIGAFAISLFIGDFFYYWYHRCAHRLPFMWQVHKLHHMDERLNVLSNMRDSWLEGFFQVFFIALPMAVFFKLDSSGGSTAEALSIIVGSVWPSFYHSNTRFQMGKADKLIVTPQVHRIHHSVLPQHVDKNFANFFPVFDIIFGTYCPPMRNEFPPTGVEGEREVQSLSEAVLLPLRGWLRMLGERSRSNVTPT
jgi:sterol desaturase/sphingolipid hydroxylase (fatty acid hydroxylase superfamily)